PEVVAAAEKHAKKPPITDRPADHLKPEWEALRDHAIALPGCDGSDEDVLTAAMFPQVAPKFFASRADGPKNVGKDPKAAKADGKSDGKGPITGPVTYEIKVGDKAHKVMVRPA